MMENSQSAPIIVFVYNRLQHVEKMIENLVQCELASNSDLYIYSDGAKSEKDEIAVHQVREFCKTISGFRSLNIIQRDKNFGLAANIIDGVTEVVNRHGTVIVMEDDLIVHHQFLIYMNNCLNKFKDNAGILHISGWNYPIDESGLPDIFLTRIMNCWGWATWKDRWVNFDKNSESLVKIFDKKMINEFDVENSGVFWSQVIGNLTGRINTWAIFWYATIYLNKGLCVNPKISLVTNIGHDGSGTHKSQAENIYSPILRTQDINHWDYEIGKIENQLAYKRIQEFYKNLKPKITTRILNKMKKILGV